MKDRVLLVLAAIVFSGLVWSFWHFLGDQAFVALPTIVMIIFAIDNHRLRQKLRDLGRADQS